MKVKKVNFFSRKKVRIGHFDHSIRSLTKTLDVIRKIPHPMYIEGVAYFDIAILQTANVTYTPVCLPQVSAANYEKFDYRSVELTGWGSQNALGSGFKKLNRLTLTVFPFR